MTTVPVLADPDGPAWLACARCGHTAARIDAFLAHVRECQGAWEVREVLAEADAPILAQAPAAPPQALAVVPAAEPAPEHRPVLAAATLSQIAREEDRDWRAFGQEKRRGKATPTRRLTNDSRRPTKTKAAAPASLEVTKPAPRPAPAPVLPIAPNPAGLPRLPRPIGPVPHLGLSAGQAEIALGLYEGRVLLVHVDERDTAWWQDVGRGRPVSVPAMSGLIRRGLVAPYGWPSNAPFRRLLLTDEGRLLAGQIEFALGLAQEA